MAGGASRPRRGEPRHPRGSPSAAPAAPRRPSAPWRRGSPGSGAGLGRGTGPSWPSPTGGGATATRPAAGLSPTPAPRPTPRAPHWMPGRSRCCATRRKRSSSTRTSHPIRLAGWNRIHFLERCALFGTVLADEDSVYDPQDCNDRRLLGLKRTISEFKRERHPGDGTASSVAIAKAIGLAGVPTSRLGVY